MRSTNRSRGSSTTPISLDRQAIEDLRRDVERLGEPGDRQRAVVGRGDPRDVVGHDRPPEAQGADGERRLPGTGVAQDDDRPGAIDDDGTVQGEPTMDRHGVREDVLHRAAERLCRSVREQPGRRRGSRRRHARRRCRHGGGSRRPPRCTRARRRRTSRPADGRAPAAVTPRSTAPARRHRPPSGTARTGRRGPASVRSSSASSDTAMPATEITRRMGSRPYSSSRASDPTQP